MGRCRGIGLAVLLALGGCSSPDPATVRLEPGRDAIVFDAVTKNVRVHALPLLFDGKVFVENAGGDVPVGTHLTVILDDQGKDDDADRSVRVRIQEGEYQGHEGKVARGSLRAIH